MGQHAKLYNSHRWRAIRRSQLDKEPLCRMCAKSDRITSATVCDHIEPHRGDPARFYAGPFQSLCAPCHSGEKQAQEKSGVVRQQIGADGWPTR
jgi:5-methylcytosine-specific restriction protein A